jgi:hypothetical protein
MKKLNIKIICGFRKDQQFSINIEEAHKAYYLFLHPNERGIFSNGIAMTGNQIQRIEPDYIEIMGWKDHELDAEDWQEIRSSKADVQLRNAMAMAKDIATKEAPEKMSLPLSEIRPLLI